MAKNTRKKSHRRSTSRPSSDPPTPPTSGPIPPTSGRSTPQTPSPSTPRTPGPTPTTSGRSTPQPSPSTPRTHGPPDPTLPTSGGSTPQTPSPSNPQTSGSSIPQADLASTSASTSISTSAEDRRSTSSPSSDPPTPRASGPISPTSGRSTPQTPSPLTPRTPGPTPTISRRSTPQQSPSTPRTPGPPGPTPPTSGGSTPQTPSPSNPQTSGSSIPQADLASTSASTSISTSAEDRSEVNSEEELVAFVKYNCQNVYQADDTTPTNIKETEDDLRKYLDKGKRSIKALLPSRPQQISINPYRHQVFVNHFEIEVPNNAQFTLYNMTWRSLSRNAQPEGPGRFEARLKRLWWDEIYEANRAAHMEDIPTVYEGKGQMVAREPFKSWPGGVKTLTHNNGSEVTVKFITTINVDNYNKFTNKIASDECQFPNDVVKIVNLLVRKYCTNAHYRDEKRWYYDLGSNDQRFQDPSMIKKFAYFQSARCLGGGTTGSLSLNVDVTSSIFFREGTQLPELWDLYGGSHLQKQSNGRFSYLPPFPDGIPIKKWTNQQVQYVHRLWRKMRIKSYHDSRRQPRDFTIHEVKTGSPALEVEVPLYRAESREVITLNKLLQYSYGVTSTNIAPKIYYMPALKVQKYKESYLTWDCCETTPESRFAGKEEDLPYGVKSQLRRLDNPQERHGNIAKWMQDRGQRAPQFDACAGWGVTVSSKMMSVNALLLEKPQLEFRSSVTIPSHLGSFNILQFDKDNKTTTKLLETKGESYRYALLPIQMTHDDFACWHTHLTVLQDMAPRRMVQLVEVIRSEHQVDSMKPATERQKALKRTILTLTNECKVLGLKFDIIICLMPKRLTPEYGTLKFGCDKGLGVPSQVLIMNPSKDKGPTHKDVQSRVESFMLKINVKCGGQNFKVDRELFVMDPSTMLLGADVTHGFPSIAAVVATTDSKAGRYACRIKPQNPNQEKIGDLEQMFTELLYVYGSTTRTRPNNIILFRDGVSEREFVNTLRHEGTAILKACTALHPEYRPNLLIVLAIKRHHTRFFKMKDDGRIENIGEGVVVNQGVTHPRVHEFFLCSQFPVLGTSRAVRYHVLLDEIYKTKRAKELYKLVYNLCHTCQRATRSVALVTPTYYAHLAAFRAKLYMEYWKVENPMPAANPPEPRKAWLDRALQEDLNAHSNLRDGLWFL